MSRRDQIRKLKQQTGAQGSPPVLAGPADWATTWDGEVMEFAVPGARRATPADLATFASACRARVATTATFRAQQLERAAVAALATKAPASSPAPTGPRVDPLAVQTSDGYRRRASFLDAWERADHGDVDRFPQ